ncbi:MAG: Diaminopimelate decarboxylase [Candidatus Hydrogenedentes bacterium ADurb.Bin101]|nr:MAG: Diaminopimelate decarboxylase [Candidatus Hydrogenedentes bacterium ADurb.Bin101]
MGSTPFLSKEQAFTVRETCGTPVYVYDEGTLEASAAAVLAFPNAFGLTARFAMKALPTAAILRLFDRMGLHMDAGSGYEAERAMRAGIVPDHIQITSQDLPWNLKELVEKGCLFNACSLRQLETYGQLFPETETCVRINPGLGSGHSNRTNVGGPSSSFGIWHQYVSQVLEVARRYGLRVTGMHTHIGSGTDPEVWLHCAQLALDIAARLPEVTRLSLGGGFKPARMEYEDHADLEAIGNRLIPEFKAFAASQGRELRLEIEPGAYLTANAGVMLCSVTDVVDTGDEGFDFIKTDAGMNDIMRPALYGAQHPITLFPASSRDSEHADYLVVGHCCESGDILSPEPGNPEGLKTRTLTRAEAGDILVIGGAGAYCASMAAKNYNSFPESPEVLLTKDGALNLIRRRQSMEHMLENEVLN